MDCIDDNLCYKLFNKSSYTITIHTKSNTVDLRPSQEDRWDVWVSVCRAREFYIVVERGMDIFSLEGKIFEVTCSIVSFMRQGCKNL